MVRVGGGWDEFEHFLSRHDPEKIGKVLLCKFCWHLFSLLYLYLNFSQVLAFLFAQKLSCAKMSNYQMV